MSDEPKEESGGSPFLNVVAVLFILGILAAIALPGMTPKFGSRSKMSEAKANLKAAYTSHRAYFAEKDVYDPHAASIGFGPERGNRYAYFLATRGPVQRRDKAEVPSMPANDVVIIGGDSFRYPGTREFASFGETGCPIAPCVSPAGTRLVGPGLVNEPTGGAFMVAAVGNIDGDETLDCWSICSENRTAADGSVITGSVPWNDRNDVTE